MKRIIFLLTAIFMCIGAHAKTETINWYMDGNTYATTQCETGSDIILPQTPYKYGYTFNGWIGYIPVEYLESTGTQWIDTGVVANIKTKLVSYEAIFSNTGCGTDDGGLHFILEEPGIRTGGTYAYINYNKGDVITINNFYDVNGNRTVEINGILSVGTPGSFPSMSICLFGLLSVSGTSWLGIQRIYYFQIYDNDILVRNFIPVLDSNNVPCMFDKVEKKFYYNQGTGQFIAGPVIGE